MSNSKKKPVVRHADYIDIPKEILVELYQKQGLTQKEIGKQLGVSDTLIRIRLKEHGISTRKKFTLPKHILKKLYLQDGLTCREIGQQFGVSHATIRNLLTEYDISSPVVRATPSQAELEYLYLEQKWTQAQIAAHFGLGEGAISDKLHEFGITKPTIADEINLSADELRQLYEVKKLSGIKIARMYQCGVATIYDLLRQYNIPIRRTPPITQKQLEELYYEQGLTQEEVAAQLGISEPTLRVLMKKYGLKKTKHQSYIDIPKAELERLYGQENLTTVEIAKIYGCAISVIDKRMAEHGITTKKRGWDKVKQIVPPERLAWSSRFAYAVGLIASDGNLSKSSNEVKIASTDRELILAYCWGLGLRPRDVPANKWPDPDAVEIPVHIEDRPPYKRQYLVVFSDYVYRARLEEIGLTPNKSNTIGALTVPDEYFRDFLRGEFDGDGGFHLADKRKSHYLVAHITSGSQSYLEWLNDTIYRLGQVGPGRFHKIALWYGGEKAHALAQFMYYQPNLPCLTRKRDIWQAWLKHKNLT